MKKGQRKFEKKNFQFCRFKLIDPDISERLDNIDIIWNR